MLTFPNLSNCKTFMLGKITGIFKIISQTIFQNFNLLAKQMSINSTYILFFSETLYFSGMDEVRFIFYSTLIKLTVACINSVARKLHIHFVKRICVLYGYRPFSRTNRRHLEPGLGHRGFFYWPLCIPKLSFSITFKPIRWLGRAINKHRGSQLSRTQT